MHQSLVIVLTFIGVASVFGFIALLINIAERWGQIEENRRDMNALLKKHGYHHGEPMNTLEKRSK